ncbi:hypothetical protein PAPHI01_0478 [Pancytospora philotis]|nr:hypothetical protein PAPHI01_0478 [Pancytospora philotis]
MEEEKNSIKELVARMRTVSASNSLEKLVSQYKQRTRKLQGVIEELEYNVALVTRKNNQIATEIEQEIMQQGKVVGQFSKNNSERLRMSKQYVNLEQVNANLEYEIADTKKSTEELENAIRDYSGPAQEVLYYELMRGFGVDFVSRDGGDACKVTNTKRNDVYFIETRDRPAEEVCEAVWAAMADK